MANPPKPKAVLQIRIMFDTNICWVDSELFLLHRQLSDLILDSSSKNLEIQWLLSDVVKHERQFQMSANAAAYLGLLRKLERFLDRDFGISPDALNARTAQLIEAEVLKHSLRPQALDIAAVDWRRLITDAVFRRPPFEDSETEKGFRDALILETFCQLVSDSDPDPRKCRVVFASNDSELIRAAELRTAKSTNVAMFSRRDELKGYINAMISEISTREIDSWNHRAASFLDGGSTRAKAFRHRIEIAVSEALKTDVILPAGFDSYTIQNYRYEDPIFYQQVRRKSARARNIWSMRINVDLEFRRPVPSASPSISAQPVLYNLGLTGTPAGSYASGITLSPDSPSLFQKVLSGKELGLPENSPMTLFAGLKGIVETRPSLKATASFNIDWSAHFSVSGRLLRPKVDNVGSGEYILGV